jgi:hypothetical protein
VPAASPGAGGAASSFWIRADNLQTAVQTAHHRVAEFGYGGEEGGRQAASDVAAMYVVLLIACEEARAERRGYDRPSFVDHVVRQLPDQDEIDHSEPMLTSSLRRLAESLWGVRVTFTHSDGQLTQLRAQSHQWAERAPSHIRGVTASGHQLEIDGGIMHPALRTIEAIRATLDPHVS